MGSQPRDVTDLRNAVVDMTCECAAEHLAALDALVASLTAARQERDEAREEARVAMDLTHIAKRELHEVENRVDSMRGARDAARSCYRQSEATLEAARQREQQLTQALAEIAHLPGEGVGWWRARTLAVDALIAAGEAPPTAPPESGSAKNCMFPACSQGHGVGRFCDTCARPALLRDASTPREETP